MGMDNRCDNHGPCKCVGDRGRDTRRGGVEVGGEIKKQRSGHVKFHRPVMPPPHHYSSPQACTAVPSRPASSAGSVEADFVCLATRSTWPCVSRRHAHPAVSRCEPHRHLILHTPHIFTPHTSRITVGNKTPPWLHPDVNTRYTIASHTSRHTFEMT